MISKSAVLEFVAKDVRDLTWLKKLGENTVDRHLTKLEPKVKFHTTPRWHQKICYLIGCKLTRFMFSCDTGSGKSKILLDILRYRKAKNGLRRTLILAKNEVSVENWLDEINIHTPDLTAMSISGSYMEKLQVALTSDADILLCHYPGFAYLCSLHAQSKKHTGLGPIRLSKKGRQKWEVNHVLIDDLLERFDCIAFDEIHKIKNHTSLPHRICRKFADNMKFVYGLTGTPFGRDPQDLWGEFRVIDKGETLGDTISLYRAAFFREVEDRWAGVKYEFDKRHKKILHKKLANRSIRFASDECFDLPTIVRVPVYMRLPPETLPYYRLMNEQFKKLYTNYSAAENTFVRMRQIVSGYLGAKSDDQGRIEVSFPYNPRLESLVEILDDLDRDTKFIIMHEFRHSGMEITKALNKAKIRHVSIMGGTRNPGQLMRTFQHDPKCRGLVGAWSSIGESLNIQQADYLFFYETPVSPLARKQCEARIIRQGQQASRVYIYDFIMKGTVDARIQQFLREGRVLFDAIIEGKFDPNLMFDEEEYS